ncbi:MAG: hypothetical protein L3K17_03855 [Thermoplasmata archaeon]|nr:hypothetical protein [Thermoplasmata archaeon]
MRLSGRSGPGHAVRGDARYRTRRSLQFRKRVRASLPFVFRWCTDYREDDDRLTDDLYHYSTRILLREADRVVREVVVPGKDRNRCTEVEIISLSPPDRWTLRKFSVTDDKIGRYRLVPVGPRLTRIEMRFEERWKVGRPPSRERYRALFNRVWDRYVTRMEQEFRGRDGPGRAPCTETGGLTRPDARRRPGRYGPPRPC